MYRPPWPTSWAPGGQQQAHQLHQSIPGFGCHQSALNKTVTWLSSLRVWCDSYLAATGGSCEYRSPMCFALFMYSLQCLVGGLKWWWMNQEKRTKVISFVFFHPTSCVVQCHLWVATIPTHVAARSGSCVTLAGGAPAGRRRDISSQGCRPCLDSK